MRVPVRKQGKLSGFTLVEMAIVLVIIGIILAGVMKGRDIVRGSQVKAFTQQFAQKWGTVAQTYYDKTGQFFNDGNGNGNGVASGGAIATAPDGQMDGGLGALLTTETGTYPGGNGPVDTLESVGITPCTLIKSKYNQSITTTVTGQVDASCVDSNNVGVNIGVTQVEGEYSGVKIVEVDLIYLLITTNAGTTYNRNCVLLYDVPTDVAMGMDTSIDGSLSGESGAVLNLEDVDTGNAPTQLAVGDGVTTAPWPSAADQGTQVVAIILDF